MVRDMAKVFTNTITVMCIQDSGFIILKKAMGDWRIKKKTPMKVSS